MRDYDYVVIKQNDIEKQPYLTTDGSLYVFSTYNPIFYRGDISFHEKIPQKTILNKNAAILFWNDKTKTVVKRTKKDEPNPRLAFLTAYFQKMSGMSRTKANIYLDNLEVENE